MTSNIVFAVSDGTIMLFWHDEWTSGCGPGSCFSRILALAENNNSKIVEYGGWEKER